MEGSLVTFTAAVVGFTNVFLCDIQQCLLLSSPVVLSTACFQHLQRHRPPPPPLSFLVKMFHVIFALCP